ncbi:protein LYRIC-like isoform X1 [Malaclemys terrapin pileata]|uniref:protein LYRIC-like isoform X1 n=1 Tax=Malaclemys terrapin pileata TaxID=2991368 RepID=UPI0023A7DC8D|nr:protein LYRIC-like isoform X1 [Malaclemys terrapin pileata]
MLESAVRLALGAGELVAPGPQLSERLALLQAQVLASLWPMLLLGGAVALLVLLGMLRRWDRARPGPQHSAAGEEGGAGSASYEEGRLPAPAPRTQNGIAGQQEQRARQSHEAKVPVNCQLLTSVGMREKKLLKSKKKKKTQCSEKGTSKDHVSAEKDKLLEEEEGVWQTKISSREKRHLRKERLKQKENHSRESLGTMVVEAVFDGDGKGTVWPHTVSGTEDNSSSGQGALCESGTKKDGGSALRNSEATGEESEPTWSEEDVFSNVGTWDIAEAKSYPVTFGTLPELSMELSNLKSKSSQDNPSKYNWNANLPFLTVDDAWLGQHDPLAIDLNSDWNAPTEEWGNWLGVEETCTGPEREKPQQGLEMRTEEGQRELISMKHSSHATCTSFKIPQDPANNLPHNDVPGKKERRKRKKMRKET